MEPAIERNCSVCGEPNRCAVAETGTFETRCWCEDVKFSAAALGRVPDNARGKACLCPRCASELEEEQK